MKNEVNLQPKNHNSRLPESVYFRRRIGALTLATMGTFMGLRLIDTYNGPECSSDLQEIYVGDNGINTVWEMANTINRGADVRDVVKVILDMNPQLEPGNLQYGELVVTPTECNA